MALIPPGFLDFVVAVGTPSPAGTTWSASGFFYLLAETVEGENIRGHAYVVTNKHVVEGKTEMVIRCNPKGNDPAKEYTSTLLRDDGSPLWYGHPDPDVDVAVIPINYQVLLQEGMQVGLFLSTSHVLRVGEMQKQGVTEGDPVYVLGFPMGLVGSHRSAVISRGGTIARVQDLYSGAAKEFIVDAFVFPGNSGGPAISCPEVVSITGTDAVNSAYLLGVVKGYIPFSDIAVSSQTSRPRVIFEDNTGLSAVQTVDQIEEAIQLHLSSLPASPASEEESEVVSGTSQV